MWLPAHSFHPIQDYLHGLEWDGVLRIRTALHHFLGAEISDLHEACLQTFMLGAVHRVFEPGSKFDLMLVLIGGQGAGKSTFLRFLAIRDEWFSDDLKKLDDEKIYQRLAGHWILEMSEMVATANACSIEDIKSFLSRNKQPLRPLCGRSSPAVRLRRHHQQSRLPADGPQRQPALSACSGEPGSG